MHGDGIYVVDIQERRGLTISWNGQVDTNP